MRADFNARYVSNHGDGPEEARIVEMGEDYLIMERRAINAAPKPVHTRFRLSLSFFDSPSCGWKLVDALADGREGEGAGS